MNIINTIVAFHIGRGGNYNDAGYLTFLGVNPISYYTNDLFVGYINAYRVFKLLGDRENLKEKYYEAIGGDKAAQHLFDRLGLSLGKEIYLDSAGSPVGLSLAQESTGVGVINIDNEYDTTYCKYLINIDVNEAHAIINSSLNCDAEIIDYAKQILGQ